MQEQIQMQKLHLNLFLHLYLKMFFHFTPNGRFPFPSFLPNFAIHSLCQFSHQFKTMKKIAFILVLIFMGSAPASAQIFKKLGNRAKNKTTKELGKKTDKEIEKVFDKDKKKEEEEKPESPPIDTGF